MRKPMVTRSFITTKVTVLCMDVETAEPCNKVVAIPRQHTDAKKLFKLVEEAINTETLKAVHIVDTVEEEKLLGMSEADFIKYAVELDSETRKPIETEEA